MSSQDGQIVAVEERVGCDGFHGRASVSVKVAIVKKVYRYFERRSFMMEVNRKTRLVNRKISETLYQG